jgi:hypothetical protein
MSRERGREREIKLPEFDKLDEALPDSHELKILLSLLFGGVEVV